PANRDAIGHGRDQHAKLVGLALGDVDAGDHYAGGATHGPQITHLSVGFAADRVTVDVLHSEAGARRAHHPRELLVDVAAAQVAVAHGKRIADTALEVVPVVAVVGARAEELHQLCRHTDREAN